MAAGGKGAGGAGGGDGPDPHLPLLERGQADRFRALVGRVLAERGYEAEVGGDRAVLADGTELGLHDLVRLCLPHERGEAGWPEVVAGHLAVVATRLAALDPGLPRMSEREYRDSLIVRLIDPETLPEGIGPFEHRRTPVPGLWQILCLDLTDAVQLLTDTHVEQIAGPLDGAVAVGGANLRAEMGCSRFALEPVSEGGATFTSLTGESPYTATLAVILPEVIHRWQPEADLSQGVVFAVPFRHQLAFLTCVGPRPPTVADLGLLARYAVDAHATGMGPLSPHTYYWRDNAVSRITSREDGAWHVRPGRELAEVLRR